MPVTAMVPSSSVRCNLSLAHSAFLFQSTFLLSLGLLLLGGYAFLGKRYWFSVPFRGILLATVFYVIALIINWA